MYLFFESICIKNKLPQHLYLHQNRINYTLKKFHKKHDYINLKTIISKLDFQNMKIYKVKIIYSNTLKDIILEEYKPKIHTLFKFIKIKKNIYKYKFLDRKIINQFKKKNKEEIIFILNNYITDTSYSNLIFKKNNKWYTPNTYLLNGTQRKYLIKNKKIQEVQISLNKLKEFNSFKLINAMNDIDSSYEYNLYKNLIFDHI